MALMQPAVARRASRFGLSIDPQNNINHRRAVQRGVTLTALAEEFIFPHCGKGDAGLLRFPFSPVTDGPYVYRWRDAWMCPPERYDDVANFAEACVSRGIEPMIYVPEPTGAELEEACAGGDIALPFADAEWSGATIVVDEGIANKYGNARKPKLRARMNEIGRRMILEPGWDRGVPADWDYPIICASDLRREVAADGGKTWRWPWPANGPDIWLWHHDDPKGDVLGSLQAHWQFCKGRRYHAMIPASFFALAGISRNAVTGA